MRRLPQKSVKGANLKKWLVESIDALIDYLSDASYLQPGTGIGIDRTASGIMISALKPKPAPAQSLAGGTVQNLSATVSGGTATVALSGSTATVPFVAGANVNITGGTNGEVIVSATGGTGSVMGFPDFSNGTSISGGTNYPVSADSWLIGHVGLYAGSGNYPTHLSGYVDLKVSATATPSSSNTIELYCNQGLYEVVHSGLNEWFPVCIPIKAGYTIRLTVSGSASANLYLFST